MTATNHALTGAAIGLIIGQPLIAVPVALASHFICDILPHYAAHPGGDAWIRTRHFRNYVLITAAACILLVICLAIFRPEHWFLASVCAFVATSPDILWVERYIKVKQGKPWKQNALLKLTEDIQWFSKPIGAVVEAAWFIAAIIVILPFFR